MIFRLKNAPEGFEGPAAELLKERGHRLYASGEDMLPEEETLSRNAQHSGNAQPPVELCAALTEEKKVSVVYTAGSGDETPSAAALCACGRAFLFRALMRLVRELEKRGTGESFQVEENVWLDRNGVMLDCSRNSVLTAERIRWYIRLEASLGMNTLMLYTEDTYEVPEYPYFGAYRGRYSASELRGLSEYADRFGIEMIPCIQALAHLKNALRWETMRGMQDTDDILMAGGAGKPPQRRTICLIP